MRWICIPGGRSAHALLALAAALLMAAPAAGQMGYRVDPQGKDELWDVTSKMEMPGLPMAMPAQTNRVCIEKGGDSSMVPKQEGCTVTDVKRAGNTVTYRMACKSGRNDYTASGESTTSSNGYQGKMRMTGKMEGEQMDMAMTYSGARAGNCTSTIRQDVAAMKAQGEKASADMCRDGIDKLQWMLFFSDSRPACAQKAEFCGAVSRAAQSMQDPAQYAAATGKFADLKTSFAKCGQDLAVTTRAACAHATGSRNWRFVGGGNCDDDVRAQGRGRCEGRGGSPDPEYYPLCARYVTITRGASGQTMQPMQPARAPSAQDPAQQNLDAVRKLLPF